MIRSLIAFGWLTATAALSVAADKPPVVKLESPPKAEWQVIQADPAMTTLSLDVAGQWFLIDEAGARLKAASDGKSAEFAAEADGRYRVLVVCEKVAHRIELVKGKPPEPTPGPGPDPKPTDPLVKLLQTACDLDARAADAKRKDVLDMVELYRQAAVLAAVAEVTTTGQLVARVRDAAKSLGVVGLADCRKVIGAELAAVFPDDVSLSTDSRKKAADLFSRIKSCLEQVK